MLVFPPGKLLLGLVSPFLTNEPLQLPLPDKSFYLLLQVVAVECIMTMIAVDVVVLVFGPLVRVSLQFARECQGFFVLDQHQDLINQGVQWGEACESLSGRFKASIFSSVSRPCCLSSPILSCFLLSFSLLRLLFAG